MCKYVLCLFVSVGTEMSQYESMSPHLDEDVVFIPR